MRNRLRRPSWLAAIVAVGIAAPLAAEAALGEQASSIASDRKALRAVSRGISDRGRFSVHEMETVSGTIREYVAPSGVVFGIAWRGLAHPELGRLLGRYHAEYRAALARTPREPGRRHLQVRTERVVVEKWGHMRDLRGRAFAPALVPPGVTADEIR